MKYKFKIGDIIREKKYHDGFYWAMPDIGIIKQRLTGKGYRVKWGKFSCFQSKTWMERNHIKIPRSEIAGVIFKYPELFR